MSQHGWRKSALSSKIAGHWPAVIGFSGSAVLFGLCLAEAVSGFILPAEKRALLSLHAVAPSWLNSAMRWVSDVGEGRYAAIAGIVVVVILLIRRRFSSTAQVSALLVGAGIGGLLKPLVERPRPELWPGAQTPTDFSFPSGHALGSAALIVALAVLAWPTRWRKLVVALGALWVLTVGFSRLVVGAHYPSDIVGAWSFIAMWAVVVLLVIRRLQRRFAGRCNPE